MTQMIKDTLYVKVPVEITPALAKAVIHFVTAYETRPGNAEAFTSPYLGLYNCFFKNTDRDEFFNLFNIDTKDLTTMVSKNSNGRDKIFGVDVKKVENRNKGVLEGFIRDANEYGITNSEMRRIITTIPSIDTNFRVSSDPFNLFCIYMAHRFYSSKINETLKMDAAKKVFMLLQYRFFTSLVNHRFKYKADEAIMRATFENLTAKFDIKQYGTWRAVMEARTESMFDKTSIHINAITNFNVDDDILYVITDLQTRIRNQINIVTEEFMRAKENNDKIASYSHIGENNEGEKIIMSAESGFDMMINSLYNDCLVVSRIIDDQALRLTVGLFSQLQLSKLRALIVSFSEYAVKQAKEGSSDKIVKLQDREVIVGSHALVQAIVQRSYRYCINTGVDISKPVLILRAIRDVYRSSRISDDGIIQLKDSTNDLVLELQSSRREATVSALRIAFVIYLILISFRYLR